MKLLRSFTLGAALVAAALVSPRDAAAQFSPGQLTSSDHAAIVGFGPYSPYGTYSAQMLNSPGQPVLDAWCIDFLNGINGYPVDVNMTSLEASAGDLDARTRYGSANLASYQKAAYLTQFFAGATTQAEAKDIHCTIWQLFNAGPGLVDCTGASTASWLSQANTNFGSGSYRYWFVMSDVQLAATYGNTQVDRLQIGEQEFLVYATPEPGTYLLLMTGLVGLSAAGYRRRRNKTN